MGIDAEMQHLPTDFCSFDFHTGLQLAVKLCDSKNICKGQNKMFIFEVADQFKITMNYLASMINNYFPLKI